MYCSSCGAEASAGLSYCKRCGARLNGIGDMDDSEYVRKRYEALVVAAIAMTFLGGIGLTIALMVFMKQLGFNDGLVLGFGLLTLTLMVATEAVFVWLLMRQKSRSAKSTDAERQANLTTSDFGPADIRALPEPVASITDHTTRLIEPVYNERETE